MDVNVRSADMWRILRNEETFGGMNMVDFGCGYGDLMLFALRDGAANVLGVDKDQRVLNTAAEKCRDIRAGFYCADFEDDGAFDSILRLAGKYHGANLDVAFCFSVLPYMKDPEGFVEKLRKNFGTVYIECQYIGDGPGNIAHDDAEMASWLLDRGFGSTYALGKTHVEIRDKYRTIWECW